VTGPPLTVERPAAPRAATVRVARATPSSWVGLAIGLALFGWLLYGTRDLDQAFQNDITRVCIFITLASMWNLLAGYTGLVSIGQQAFFGLGGYGLIVVSNGFDQDIYFSVLPAGSIALGAAAVIAVVAFRLRGGYFAVGMWVIAEVVRLLVKNYRGDPIRGGTGTSLDAGGYDALSRSQTSSLLALLLAATAIVAVYLVLRSRLGLALQAVRDDEAGASGLGVHVYATRYVVFLLAGFLTGLAGAVHYLKFGSINPDAAFSVSVWTAPVIMMVVIGGLGTIEGPIIGTVIYYVLEQRLTGEGAWVDLDPEVFRIVMGAVALVFALCVRGGIWGTATRHFPNLQLFPLRRRVTTEEVRA
jgi:branched-chain amino acid transport system permease protein